jgi:SAM-dependent methyltransferase
MPLKASQSFSLAADRYAAARPRYPDTLFQWITRQSPRHGAVWDCATGNGQAAASLATQFARVYASDISVSQLQHAAPRSNIIYLAQAAERTAFKDHTFDLVTVATALHWFDFPRFWPEVTRVLKPGGLFCAWSYASMNGPDDARCALLDPVNQIVSPFWSSQNGISWRGYDAREIGFPFPAITPPAFSIEVRWTAAQLAAYITTWSAYKLASADPELRGRLERVIDAGLRDLGRDTVFEISMPLAVIAGKREV